MAWFTAHVFAAQTADKQKGDEMTRRSLVPSAIAVAILGTFPASGQTFNLLPGPGRELVENPCGGCHVINRLGAGYTAEGWRSVEHMMRNMEVPITPEQWPVVTEYLIQSFPEKPKPAAVILNGPVQVSIQEWPVPTPGSRPHDPWASRDGAIWYTGQTANVLGRLDPKTGQVKSIS
jgi:virginiamycin B lyase